MDVNRVGANAAVEATEEILDCSSTRLRKGECIGQEVIRHFNVIIKFRLGLLTVIVNQSFPQYPESQSLSGQWHELLPQEDNSVVPGVAMKQVPTELELFASRFYSQPASARWLG